MEDETTTPATVSSFNWVRGPRTPKENKCKLHTRMVK